VRAAPWLKPRRASQWSDLVPLRDAALLPADAAAAAAPRAALLRALAAALCAAPLPTRREWLLAALEAAAAGSASASALGALSATATLAAAWHAPSDALCLWQLPCGDDACVHALPSTLPALLASPGWPGGTAPLAATHLLAVAAAARARGAARAAGVAAAAVRGLKALLPEELGAADTLATACCA
jgi:hypothetical protein